MSMISDKKELPLISIVLPTYNRAYILPEAVRSVLEQTYSTWELIIVDDGSTDDTREVIERFADLRIRYIKHETNKGLAASRNTGITNARGAYIANLDSDDTWLPQKLEKEIFVFNNKNPQPDIVYSAYERTLANGRTVQLPPETVSPKEGDLQKVFLASNIISMQMALIKRGVFETYGMFDETIESMQDWELWLRLAPHCKFTYVPEILTRGTVLADSITKNQNKRLIGREAIFQKHELLFKTVPIAYASHAYSIGHTYALRGNTSHALMYLKKAATTKPLRIKYTLSFLLALILTYFCKPELYKKIALSF